MPAEIGIDITALRHALMDAVADLPGRTQVVLGPTEMGPASELRFQITKVVGPPSPETEEVVDELFNTLPEKVQAMDGGNAYVNKCSGHRLFATGTDQPEIGCEWSVKVLA